MSERRTQVADAAIVVLGERGLRALTHRAVDAAAELPAGSTSNVARSRADLVTAVLDRLLDRETTTWRELAESDPVAGPVTVLAAAVDLLAGPARSLTLARQALFHEAAFDAALRRQVAAARAQLIVIARDWLSTHGVHTDERGAAAVLAVFDGVLTARLVTPEPDVDAALAFAAVLAGLPGAL